MSDLKVGDVAPDFELLDDAGRKVKLSSFRGKPVVLFFYPEDDTPGCSQQACSFRDEFEGFAEAGAVVLGLSSDGVTSHALFRKKFSLPYSLLVDPQNKIAIRYGSFGEKQMYGNTVVGTIRSSIVIDAGGRVASIHRNVRTGGNGSRMLEVIRKLV